MSTTLQINVVLINFTKLNLLITIVHLVTELSDQSRSRIYRYQVSQCTVLIEKKDQGSRKEQRHNRNTNASNINLKDLYFEYKLLPRIVGEPTFGSFHEMLKQLKANAAAVPCMLWGGANGYLGCWPMLPNIILLSQESLLSPAHARTIGSESRRDKISDTVAQDAI